MLSRVQLLGTVVVIAFSADGACSTGAVEPFYADSLIEKTRINFLAYFDDCPDTFMADNGVIRTPSRKRTDF